MPNECGRDSEANLPGSLITTPSPATPPRAGFALVDVQSPGIAEPDRLGSRPGVESAGFEEMTKADEMGFQGCEPGGLILTTDEFVVIYGRSAESP